jgi:hypothetical protein
MLDVPRRLCRKAEDTTVLGAGCGVSRATAYRYVAEGISRPDLHDALQRTAGRGLGLRRQTLRLRPAHRVRHQRQGKTIDAWYSGKHRDLGANVQVIIRPAGIPIWTSDSIPGHLHDLTCAREFGVTAVRNWTAAELDLPALADAGYDGARHGSKDPSRANASQSRIGCSVVCARQGRPRPDRTPKRHSTASPRRIGDILRPRAARSTPHSQKYQTRFLGCLRRRGAHCMTETGGSGATRGSSAHREDERRSPCPT